MVNVCIVYSEDSVAWSRFIEDGVRPDFPSCTIQAYEDLTLVAQSWSEELDYLNNADIVVVIFSPSLHARLETYQDFYFTSLNAAPRQRILVYCGLTHEDLCQAHFLDRFSHFEQWQRIIVGETNEQASDMVEVVKESVQKVISCSSRETPDITPRVEGPKTTPHFDSHKVASLPRKRKSWSASVHPKQISCGTDTDALLIFKSELEFSDTELELYLEGEQEFDRASLTATYVNAYSYKFTAPDHPPGHIKVSIMRDKMCIGTTEFNYIGHIREHEKVSQLYLRLFNVFLEQTGSRQQLDALDQALQKHLCNQEKSCDIFRIYETEFESESSSEELPTLLHLAAKFGLKETTAWLSGQPGAQMACSIVNKQGWYPHDIANHVGQPELAAFLQDIIALEQDTEELYEEMVQYVRPSATTILPASEDLYMPMDGHNMHNPRDYHVPRYKKPFPVPLSIVMDDENYAVMTEGATCSLDPLSLSDPGKGSDGYLSMTRASPAFDRRTSEPALKVEALSQERKGPAPFEPMEPSDEYSHYKTLPPKSAPSDLAKKRNFSEPYNLHQMGDLLPELRTIPSSQQELIDIMEKVKCGEYTQEEAEYLFFDWQFKHKRSSAAGSFKEKQKQMQELKEQYAKCKSNITKGDKASQRPKQKSKWFSSRKQKEKEMYAPLPQIHKEQTKVYRKKPVEPSIPEFEPRPDSDVERRLHGDDSSDGNRDSGFPQEDTDGNDSTALSEDHHSRPVKRSESRGSIGRLRPQPPLPADLPENPPPPPPRGKGFAAPPLPPRGVSSSKN